MWTAVVERVPVGDVASVQSLCHTSRALRDLCDDPRFWKHLARAWFFIAEKPAGEERRTWREIVHWLSLGYALERHTSAHSRIWQYLARAVFGIDSKPARRPWRVIVINAVRTASPPGNDPIWRQLNWGRYGGRKWNRRDSWKRNTLWELRNDGTLDSDRSSDEEYDYENIPVAWHKHRRRALGLPPLSSAALIALHRGPVDDFADMDDVDLDELYTDLPL